ncbi:LysE family translocator [Frigidibacter sp. RF13]|uniref:LysE family translocator n=1 Tax=Frigidibacter sp. RF13 TaxID=2997340 RepID=UPI00226FCE3E|nr:LysE family translocator [Frigidibacter sp. RF13]MCY1127591.1 LysE family translocator [Frigidibacter sp. RF13]
MQADILALLLFLFPLAYSPGPGNLYFAANGARFGWRATLPANAGYHLATWLVTATIGLGFASAADAAPALLEALRWCGAAYVLYLACAFLRAPASGAALRATARSGFWEGALLLLFNPKAYVIIALMFTQFLPADPAAHTVPVLWITTIFTVNNLMAFLAWTVAGDRIAARLRDEGAARRLNQLFGLTLAAVALWMALR